MRAVCWMGVRDLRVEDVPEPEIVNPHDAIVRVTMSATCGSDLHFYNGFLPAMVPGDVIGHEFIGEVVATGRDVKRARVGRRVVVPCPIACGRCWYCENGMTSLCDNTNPKPELQEKLLGYPTAGLYGYTHAFGGYAGSHAEYIRVPHADMNCIDLPSGMSDERAVLVSDAVPTGFMAADFCAIQPGQTVAVWGAGGVGLMAMQSARLLGAERVLAIDRFPERLALARELADAETIDYTRVDSVVEVVREATAGKGPDACIDAVGMEAHGTGLDYKVDKAKQQLRLHTDRGQALRQAITACRKGGIVSVVGVYGAVDTFPMGSVLNKGLTIRSAQQFGHRYIPQLLEHVEADRLSPQRLITHEYSLEGAPAAYRMFNDKEDGCVRAVFRI